MGVAAPDRKLASETLDPEGNRVVIPTAVWFGKVLRDHSELAPHLAVVLRAISAPDHAIPDPAYAERRLHYLRHFGPSRWLLVVISYEQEPARLISAYAQRKDPPLWNT
jgi:hypothetical protein